jgi:hypothetical protein
MKGWQRIGSVIAGYLLQWFAWRVLFEWSVSACTAEEFIVRTLAFGTVVYVSIEITFWGKNGRLGKGTEDRNLEQ